MLDSAQTLADGRQVWLLYFGCRTADSYGISGVLGRISTFGSIVDELVTVLVSYLNRSTE